MHDIICTVKLFSFITLEWFNSFKSFFFNLLTSPIYEQSFQQTNQPTVIWNYIKSWIIIFFICLGSSFFYSSELISILCSLQLLCVCICTCISCFYYVFFGNLRYNWSGAIDIHFCVACYVWRIFISIILFFQKC